MSESFSFQSWSCLVEREGKCREEEEEKRGGVRLKSHIRGTTGKLCSSKLFIRLCLYSPGLGLSMHLCDSVLTGLSHSSWLFISAVILAAHAAVSRRKGELDLVDSK